MTSFLIDGTVAVDAGAITRALPIQDQSRIRHVLITHSHIDHTATLPFLIENTFGVDDDAMSIYSTRRILAVVRRHVFNNDTWPDFSRIPNRVYPRLRFVGIEAERPFVIPGLPSGDLEVTAVPVNHIVPTVGLLLRQAGSSVLFTSDTGPTQRVWEVANEAADLRAVITECSFPNRLQSLADVSLHLSPQTLAVELAKLDRATRVLIYHFKPPYVDELRAELAATELPWPVEELEQGGEYEF